MPQPRLYRLSLSSYGYQDAYVEFLGYAEHHRARVRFLSDNFIEEVPVHSLFPISSEKCDPLLEQFDAPVQSGQRDLFE